MKFCIPSTPRVSAVNCMATWAFREKNNNNNNNKAESFCRLKFNVHINVDNGKSASARMKKKKEDQFRWRKLACSQTFYFLLQVHRACVITIKTAGN